ncbi:MAG: divalent metal cation transporter [Planctomycetota bacterium]
MTEQTTLELERLESIRGRSFFGRFAGYAGMTGPGWLQAAVTLGGGSLAGALYLGVVAGYSLMWLQPLAMLCGVVMLMALSHVTLSSKGTPFDSVKRTISPVLAWGWLGATVLADVVFCAAQASLGVATVQQNLGMGGVNAYVITGVLAAVGFAAAVLYAKGSRSVNRLELILKVMVALVMVSFAIAAGVLLVNGQVDVGALLRGFVPDPRALVEPAESIEPMIAATGEGAGYWAAYVEDQQRSRIIAAFGTAVGINMTFLLPYTLINRGWGRKHRELSRFDLVLALLLPFSVATALLVVCSASAFHAQDGDVLDEAGRPLPALESGYYKVLNQRLAELGEVPTDADAAKAAADALPEAERRLAATLTNRDAKQLADTLAPVMGERPADVVFGLGVLAMALSTMIVHMMMNGFAVSQAVGRPGAFGPFVVGAAMPAGLAVFAPLAWTGDAKTALLIPAAVIATVFLPIAYLAILLLMNSRAVLAKEDRASPVANGFMVVAAGVATAASVWMLANTKRELLGWDKWGFVGIGGLVLIAVIGVVGFLRGQRKAGVSGDGVGSA